MAGKRKASGRKYSKFTPGLPLPELMLECGEDGPWVMIVKQPQPGHAFFLLSAQVEGYQSYLSGYPLSLQVAVSE